MPSDFSSVPPSTSVWIEPWVVLSLFYSHHCPSSLVCYCGRCLWLRQLLMLPECQNDVFGTSLNPWNTKRSPGGRSVCMPCVHVVWIGGPTCGCGYMLSWCMSVLLRVVISSPDTVL